MSIEEFNDLLLSVDWVIANDFTWRFSKNAMPNTIWITRHQTQTEEIEQYDIRVDGDDIYLVNVEEEDIRVEFSSDRKTMTLHRNTTPWVFTAHKKSKNPLKAS